MEKYVIRGIRDNGQEIYWAIDQNSGGYPYWSEHFGNDIKFYNTNEEALSTINSSSMVDFSKMSDGTIYYPTMIHEGIGLNNIKKQGSFALSIEKVVFETMFSKILSAEIMTKGIDF